MDDNETNYFGFSPRLTFNEKVWFDCNRVFSRFEFIFSNPIRVQDGFRYYYFCPAPIIF